MKTIVVAMLLLGSSARAEWSDLKAGLDWKTAAGLVGRPLMETKVRGGAMVTWVYDNGGYILFEHGCVRYWQAPSPPPSAVAHAIAQSGAPRVAKK